MPARPAIYLDANAGAPLKAEARDALSSILGSGTGLIPNPSSIHAHGRRSKKWVAEARECVAASLGRATDPEQIVFTSSGTEANQLAIRTALEPRLLRGEKPHWILCPTDHDSTLQMADWLRSRGGAVSYLPVGPTGLPDPGALSALWRAETALLSLVWVNNETGVICDPRPFAREAASRGALFHLDAAQAWGKLPIDVSATGASLVALSGHKIGGLAGAGALWLRPGTAAAALILGKQEKGRRGGTENVLGIVAMGAAARSLDPASWSSRLAPLRERLESVISARIPRARINGEGAARAANTSNFSFEGIEGEGLVLALDLAGYSVSAGSACSSGALEPSHVLMAMGRSRSEAMSAIRISLHDGIGWPELEGFIDALESAVSRMRTKREGLAIGI